MADDTGDVRASVMAPDRAFQVIDGGRRDGTTEGGGHHEQPPVTALGHLEGRYYLLDVDGQVRCLQARQLGSRHDILGLFLGDDTYLRKRFPRTAKITVKDAHGEDTTEERVVDFRINSAAAWLQAECGQAGLYGDHIQLRRPGVWPDADGLPAVHCGDAVLIGAAWEDAGYRRGNQIFAAAPAVARPDTPCGADVGVRLREGIAKYWNFRRPGGEIVTMGLLGTAYLGAAAPWRASGFLIGGAGCGKSKLMEVMRAASPMHHYTNDTTKAGLEQQISGRAMPSFIDEASDREDQRGARALLDLVLSAAGGTGTKGHRGGIDGNARKVEVVGSLIMASITPPDMQAQHLGRFTVVDLSAPKFGEDHSDAHLALERYARRHGAALWGRAIASWPRYIAALKQFRASLSSTGNAPREMDQLGALLAGHWIMTEEGEPTEAEALKGVLAVLEYTRDADEIKTDDAPRRMINHLLSQMVMLDRSSAHEPIASLLRAALRPAMAEIESDIRSKVERHLGNYGIRAIRANDLNADRRGRKAPRAADGNGVWFHQRHSQLQAMFDGTPFAGDRWLYEMRRLESARAPRVTVRIGPMQGSRCIWVSAEELGIEAEDLE